MWLASPSKVPSCDWPGIPLTWYPLDIQDLLSISRGLPRALDHWANTCLQLISHYKISFVFIFPRFDFLHLHQSSFLISSYSPERLLNSSIPWYLNLCLQLSSASFIQVSSHLKNMLPQFSSVYIHFLLPVLLPLIHLLSSESRIFLDLIPRGKARIRRDWL